VLEAHRSELGDDFTAYRNHTNRVVNFCVTLYPSEVEQLEKIAIAAAFHDLGIWSDRTFDYLRPSVTLACAHLTRTGRENWIQEITEMILHHHKISPYRGRGNWLVEPLRRADLIDVSMGLITFGLQRNQVREIYKMWPAAGFHKRLVQLGLMRLRTNPWNPLPMVRL
jgi:HD domain